MFTPEPVVPVLVLPVVVFDDGDLLRSILNSSAPEPAWLSLPLLEFFLSFGLFGSAATGAANGEGEPGFGGAGGAAGSGSGMSGIGGGSGGHILFFS